LDCWNEVKVVEMVRKGNLLRNGNFELGTSEDWVLAPHGLGTEACEFWVLEDGIYGSEYVGLLRVPSGNYEGYMMYDKMCDFEEHEAYLFNMSIYKSGGRFAEGVLYGYDDNGNYIDYIPFGQVTEDDNWILLSAFLRGYNNMTHFKVGFRGLTLTTIGDYYFGGCKLMPVKSIKGMYIGEYIRKDDLSSDFDYYGTCACLGRCKFYSIITVPQLSGTDVTLTIRISLYTKDWLENVIILEHPTLTEPSSDILSIEMPEIVKYRVQYIFSGTSPVADIRHDIRIVPL